MEGLYLFGGIFIGVLLMGGIIAFYTVPTIMESHAEIFCNQTGQGLLEYKTNAPWHYKSITCGGAPENDVIERDYKADVVRTYDIFEEFD